MVTTPTKVPLTILTKSRDPPSRQTSRATPKAPTRIANSSTKSTVYLKDQRLRLGLGVRIGIPNP